MKKILVLVCVALFSLGAVIVYAATVPDKIVLNESGKQGQVYFDHKAHIQRASSCKECHHKDNSGAEQKCSACHSDKARGKAVSLKEAFHTTCKECHKKNNGPTKCGACHKKK